MKSSAHETDSQVTRIDFTYIVDEIGSVLSFKKGIFFTIKELIIRPGENVRSFLREDRNRIVKPILFIIFCSFVYTIFQQWLHFEDTYFESAYSEIDSKSASIIIFEWTRNNIGYTNIFASFFVAFWLRILFRKYDYNIFELLVLLIYLVGIGMLIYAFFGVIEAFSGLSLFYFSGLLGLVYASWAIGQFFGKKRFLNYLKAFVSYILGSLLFSFSALLLGMAIDSL